MPSSRENHPLTSPTPPGERGILEGEKAALDILKGKENPFESLARPQRMDDRFLDLHVPELLATDRQLVFQIIDRFRKEEYTRAADLHPTRVVTILGDRGAGKTHLLQSLAYRDDRNSQILVRPSYFDTNIRFEEYLLSQLVANLVNLDEVYRSKPIEDIAVALTRKLLRQTILALGPTDRIFALSPKPWKRLWLLLGGGDCEGQLFENLAEALKNASGDLSAFVRRHGLEPEPCFRLIQGHLQKYEVGQDLLARLRRQLYTAMARAALLKDNEPLCRFLEGEYVGDASPNSVTNNRLDLVSRLLHALVEVCALVRLPIVFAFDNLERLFSPQNTFDPDLTRTFLNNLAQAVDNTKGMLILLVAESGLFEQVAAHMNSFAQDRLEQGVPVPGQGPISVIRLKQPAPEEIKQVVAGRLARLLPGNNDQLPAGFPFQESFFKKIPATENLRVTLRRLRDEYSRIVYGHAPSGEKAAPPVDWDRLLETTWNDQLTAAARQLEGGLASHLPLLHAGLGRLLQQLLPLSIDSWNLTQVQPTCSIGENPNYGVVSLLHWQGPNDVPTPARSVSEGNSSLKVGVGFLLGRGVGMPHDLKTKFDFFRRPAKGDRLVILWPAQNEGEELVELLPAGTRKVWDDSRHKAKTTLRRLELTDLRMLLAFPEWLNGLQGPADQSVPPEVLQVFVKEHCQSFWQWIAPPVPQIVTPCPMETSSN